MGQNEIVNYLKGKKKYYSARDLSDKVGMSSSAVCHSLKALRKYGMVKVKNETRKTKNHRRKMKVYKL